MADYMENRIYLNDGWSFYKYDSTKKQTRKQKVRLPHTNTVLPFNYTDEQQYQFVSVYEKEIEISGEYAGNLLYLTFEGAAHKADVYVNDVLVCTHNCGYTAFSAEISGQINYDEKNKIKVVLDSRESLNVPPFGHVIDYLTYGGLYREAYIDVKDNSYISDVFVKTIDNTQDKKIIEADVTVINRTPELELQFNIYADDFGNADKKVEKTPLFSTGTHTVSAYSTSMATEVEISTDVLEDWSIDTPNMYVLETVLSSNGEVKDVNRTLFGVRTAVFKKEGFYLNGELVKIRGLNRHQSYPYVGYAMPASVQEHDAYVLKHELGVNAVRTSHYPQSKYFLNACDRLGLLVFTEAPGWQYVGDDSWKAQHLKNVRDMIRQYRNHPSIILWGVRINESQDENKLYKEANRVAHDLDDTRQTSGVRYLQMSNLLEDVYAFNDFSHTGNNAGLTPRAVVTPKPWRPYLVSEFNGHMFPTKSFDCEEHRLSHALRYANVLNSMYAEDNNVSGCFGWCMADYNTHKDFGSGDKICYHGVLDMFRNPKFAASVYSSQNDENVVCEVSSSMDIGDHPGGCIGDVYVFTNADHINLYKNNEFVETFYPDKEDFPNLPHPPIKVDDFIGCLLTEKEGISEKSAAAIKKAVKAYMTEGMGGVIDPTIIAPVGLAMARDKLSIQKGMDLFYKYVGNWGSDVTIYRFDAIKNGEVVKSVTKAPVNEVIISAKVSKTTLTETTTYDAACINIIAHSKEGNLLTYCNDPIMLSVEGPIELIGPNVITLTGGATGTYVKTTGKTGKAKLIIESARCKKQTIEFKVTK